MTGVLGGHRDEARERLREIPEPIGRRSPDAHRPRGVDHALMGGSSLRCDKPRIRRRALA
jgi:hypothetical protein